jgi:tRNA(fMet)-specific endonuclease VapC
MTFLLDTNACIAHLTGRSPKLIERVRSMRPSDLVTCAVVKAELIFGALKSSRRDENLKRVKVFLAPFQCHPFDDAATEIYAHLRLQLERAGTPIGPNDLLIAAIALSRGCSVVTLNVREFSRVPELQVEVWE